MAHIRPSTAPGKTSTPRRRLEEARRFGNEATGGDALFYELRKQLHQKACALCARLPSCLFVGLSPCPQRFAPPLWGCLRGLCGCYSRLAGVAAARHRWIMIASRVGSALESSNSSRKCAAW